MDQKTSALTEAQVSAYLERIGLAAGVQGEQPSKDGLARIIEAHQNRVPFETIDLVQTGTRPDLSVDGLYKKVVEDRHGGYCFELNRLFRELLLALGYKTRPAFARPVLGGDPRAMNHRGELVELDGVLNYVDVGFGGPSSTMPVALADSQETFDGRTRFVAYDEGESWWRLDRVRDDGSTQTELMVCTAPVEDKDFDLLNTAMSLPGMLFRETQIANIRTPEGHITYRAGVLKIMENGVLSETRIGSDEERDALLRERMGFTPYAG